ncbi:unnamed protein product [Caenorhabditis sp. 36 PRJEB53466]|nr:unnamed protein product [Caenorhabditis sp. 36 PRJEB53466]
MTRKLNESTDSEGICADMSATSMSSSVHFERMFHSTTSTSRRPPSRIPALMTKSLHVPRSCSTPQNGGIEVYGSGEQLCEGYRNGRIETEMLLSRSQERRKQRASSYDPRCLVPLLSTARLTSSASASASSSHHPLLTSSSSSSSFSRLLPKRPQWVRHQPNVQLAESTVSLDSIRLHKEKPEFMLSFDSDGSEQGDETPKARRKTISLRKLKERNRKKFRSSLRRLHRPTPPNPSDSVPIPAEFLSVSSPIFYFALAFLLRILLFLSELCLPSELT